MSHLRDLFISGKQVEVRAEPEGDPIVTVWVQKPSTVQREKVLSSARAKQARSKAQFRDREGDFYLALEVEIEEIPDADLAKELAAFDEAEMRKAAYNEVLYGNAGSNWSAEEKDGVEGLDYQGILDSIEQRLGEILDFNKEAEAQDLIDASKDEEMQRLNELRSRFDAEVAAEFQTRFDGEIAKLEKKGAKALRKDLRKRSIDVQGQLEWYQEYRTQMLYYAVRYDDDHKKLYFESAKEILDLPSYVQEQLFGALDEIEVDDLKNSLTPQTS